MTLSGLEVGAHIAFGLIILNVGRYVRLEQVVKHIIQVLNLGYIGVLPYPVAGAC